MPLSIPDWLTTDMVIVKQSAGKTATGLSVKSCTGNGYRWEDGGSAAGMKRRMMWGKPAEPPESGKKRRVKAEPVAQWERSWLSILTKSLFILYNCSKYKSSAFYYMQKACRENGIIFPDRQVTNMSKDIEFKNRDRFIQLGIAIAALRKMRGLSQEKLAEKANVSRSHISAIEAPGIVRAFSLEVFFNVADALEVDPADLINASVFPDSVLNRKVKP